MRNKRWIVVGPAIGFLMVGVARADMATFQNGVAGYTGTDDTSVWTWGDNNYGATRINLGKSGGVFAGLIRFDLSSLAGQYTQVNSITLSMMLRGGSAHVGNARLITLHEIVPGNAGWVEGTGTGGGAATGEASNNWKRFQQNQWCCGGGSFVNPGTAFDAASVASITQDHNAYGTVQDFVLSGDLTGMVDTWSGDQNLNPGLAVWSEELAVNNYLMYFDSSEEASPPLLTIDFTPIPEPMTMTLLAAGIAVLTLRRRCRG